MIRARCPWGVFFSALMLASMAEAATPEVILQLVNSTGAGSAGEEIRKICPEAPGFQVYSPGLLVHTMKAEDVADPAAALRNVFGQGESQVIFEHALDAGGCPEGASSGASVTTVLDGRQYTLGVVFPSAGEDPDVYRVRIQEMRAAAASGKKGGSSGGVIAPTLLNVPVRCPRGYVGVVGFSGFRGKTLFLIVRPRDRSGDKE